ncbi:MULTISPECIES: ABC transporter substrate-binding protein [unclassified Microbacterium]|uniref:ABC transporter substrate-binding protein n=1 Tax=unclassified Microbacterium TaxID=2609290 RepID=UPI000EAA66D5|nr:MULTISPECIES: extracellular solute-binding protein [unclassified Microbacterium]MBT2484238.1 extracellular solute-binding protein [Microbacterium sp. ISL-108]RKN67165.1 extracellular solute-binding protein [Microbacterium sp. CGR2]
MISRRTIAAAAAGLILGGMVLSGCSGDSGSGSDGGEVSGTLDFYTDKAAWKPDFESLNEVSGEAADITLKTTGYSDANQYDAFIKQSFRTAKSPGLFTWHTGDSLKELVDEGLVAETTDIWTKAVDEGWVSEDLRDSYTFDDKQYCVPMNIAYWIMFYNKAAFADNGIEVPTTWDDLDAAAETLKDAGVTPYYQTSVLFTFQWFQHLVASTDPELYAGLTTGEVKYTDPEIVDVMNLWLEEQEKGWFSDAGSTTDPAVGLKQGDYAMINFGTFFAGNLEGAGMTADDYGMFAIPAVNGDLDATPVAVESGPICTAENSKQRDLGLAYSEWWMSPDAQTAWNEAHGDVAFNPKTEVSDPALAELGTEIAGDDHELYDRFFEAMPTEIVTTAIEQFGAFNANPGDPMPYLEKIQATADKYWAEQE